MRYLETTAVPLPRPIGVCSYGCAEDGLVIVTSATEGFSATSLACPRHVPDAEVHTLRMLADSLERVLHERRALRGSLAPPEIGAPWAV